MRHSTPRLTLAGIAALLLVACSSGGGGGSSSGGSNNTLPVANAGAAQNVNAGDTVALNGTASSDPDGTLINYLWTQTAGPSVTLTNVSTAQPTFTAPNVDAVTTLTFSLIVVDNSGGRSPGVTVNITVNPLVNVAPVANAGAAQTVTSGTAVSLNGTASDDPDGTITIYEWRQTAGNAVSLSSGAAAQPGFTAPTVATTTTLTFALIVTDNRGAVSPASTVNITVHPAPNVVPVANAGANQTMGSSATVTLNGTGSSDIDGTIASYAWTQTAGTAVVLSNATVAQPSFTAPVVVSVTTLTFSLVVTDNRGATSPADSVDVTINPPVVGNINVTGTVTFARVPFATSGQDANRGLWYAGPVQQPSRGVVVRARDANNPAIVHATGTTTSLGEYTLSVPGNVNINVEVVARMTSATTPTWDVRVQDGTAGNAPYVYSDAAFNVGAGATRNVAIPTGISASGVATGTRASAPFAVLDTIYQGIQTVLGVAPTTNFPALIVDWGAQANGTFFSSGTPQHIALLSALNSDTDEFDQHVVAHEFGHYIEHNFSRADSIGGSHGVGDKLDPRVAFGEGFGYAFAGIVLNDPVARDSYVNNGDFASGSFNVELNPQTSSVGAPNSDYGCWCSESSVWSILWDLHDTPPDGSDAVALGFGPLWSVLVGAQRNTPAFTTIFSFIDALKTARPADAAAINTLLAAQNIDTVSDAFGSGETHFPTNVAQAAALPLYTPISVGGGPVVVRNVDDAGNYNKLGNHRFLRFTPGTSGSVTISMTSSNPNTADPDFYLIRLGELLLPADDPPPQPETATVSVTAGATYLLDVYDCANGCGGEQGTAGDYNLTVTIN